MKNTIQNKDKNWLIIGILFLLVALLFVVSNLYPKEAIYPLIAVICVITLSIKVEIGLYFMALFLPVIGWNFYFRGLEIPFIDLLSSFVFAAFILKIVLIYIFDREKLNIRMPLLKYFLPFAVAVTVSSLLSENILASSWYDVRWIFFFYLVYIVMPFNIIRNEKILRNVIISIVISGFAVAVMGAVSIYFQDWRDSFVRVKPISIGNVFPIGSNQNLLAECLVVAVMFVLALKYWFRSQRFSNFTDLAVIFLSTAAIATFSRAGWIVLSIEGIIYFIYKGKSLSKNIINILLVLIILSPLAVYMFRLQSEYSIGVSSTQNRVLLSEIAWKAFSENPLFGKGTGEFVGLVAENTRFRAKYGDPLDSHGIWQKVLAENGLFGVLAFTWFSFAIFKNFHKSLRILKDKRDLILPLVAGSTGIYLFEFFNTSYYKGKMWLPIAIALAAINISRKKYQNAE